MSGEQFIGHRSHRENKHFSNSQKLKLITKLQAFSRDHTLKASAGWIYLDEGEYVHRWKLRNGLSRKQAKKQYVRDCADEDASFKTVKGVRYLAVQKPFEINHGDTFT